MRPRNPENRHLPINVYKRNRTRKNGKVWICYFYRMPDGKDVSLGHDLNDARRKWAELEAKAVPSEAKMMKAIFDRYERDIIPGKAPRTQKDNLAELKRLRLAFDGAPVEAITPAMIAQYRDAREAKTRANREIALLSHVFNMAREWGLCQQSNPCLGVRKNKEKPRDYYANDTVWKAVYTAACHELRDAMDLAYLTGQRPADVLSMRRDDVVEGYLLVTQGKTGKRLRIQTEMDGELNSLGKLLDRISQGNDGLLSPFLVLNRSGKRVSWPMLRNRWDEARSKAAAVADEIGDKDLAERIRQFQFRDIRPKAASEIQDITDASILLGHSKEGITERVYRRVGAVAKPAR
ncbi:integrase [Pseudomonas aeruginosa]|uniref:tyrosine-type recombinase/integrase n=1 Tax=Pseudomonas aeruginosa TaxID=287 RepID=UPI00106894DC|nr:tyrosine-type recombinase/integrase [Pseudomonas aeruginosa]TEP56561.1 integrase [Pseudomonas aeruginosa]TEP75288.1 integrase [Pseudomonas aeruginosa]